MYGQLKGLSTFEQVEFLTKYLVSYPSCNGTEGEALKANVIQEIIYSFPYFHKNPEYVWEQPINDDFLQRKNVFAFVRSPVDTKRTIILHAHIDTVHTNDYGSIQAFAHQPDALLRYFTQENIPEEIRKEAESGDWLFGRGSLDMQSGIAVHLANLLYFSENVNELEGNLLFIFNPDEEAEHRGIKDAVKELYRLKQEQGLQYEVAINNDFFSPLYQGDETKYVYVGNAGKILPSFFIQGRESHVGDALTAIDPTVISSELIRKIAYQLEFMEDVEGEHVVPPSVLLQRDGKDSYTVQTPLSAMLYFNYFLYEQTVNEAMNRLKKVTGDVVKKVAADFQNSYQKYCKQKDLPEKSIDWNIKVQTFKELVDELESKGVDPTKIMSEFLSRNIERDSRQIAFQLICELIAHDPGTTPRVILFLATPYLPNHTIQKEEPNGRKIIQLIKSSLEEISTETGEIFEMKRFFPFLADSNFLNYRGNEEDLKSLKENFPLQDQLFPMPLKEMSDLQIPAINLGVYGKDGHRWTERVYKPYSFGTLPLLIRSVIKGIFRESK